MKNQSRTRINLFGYEFFHRDSGNGLSIVSYHPRGSATWHWSVTLVKSAGEYLVSLAETRQGQWHDYYRLPFGYSMIIRQQDWHKNRVRK